MKYISEFRDGELAKSIAKKISENSDPHRYYKLMEFCGGHTHALHRYGIPHLLPNNIEMIHGPGCPVCVLPMARIDAAIFLATRPNTILCSYGDMLRVPGSKQDSLLKAKARGADIRMIYSTEDVLKIAEENKNKKIIFFAIGFETTTPPTAHLILKSKEKKLKNMFVFCNHVLTPVAMEAILSTHENEKTIDVDGFVGPAHVSVIIGSQAYDYVGKKYRKPIVISGFEPLDLMYSIYMLLQQVNTNRCDIENQYIRAVNQTGSLKSQRLMNEVLELREKFEWRGLGWIEKSGLKIKKTYAEFDAEVHFEIPLFQGEEHDACQCPAILRGRKKPKECKLFAKVCTPENPLGACMVSSEGACSAVYAYDR